VYPAASIRRLARVSTRAAQRFFAARFRPPALERALSRADEVRPRRLDDVCASLRPDEAALRDAADPRALLRPDDVVRDPALAERVAVRFFPPRPPAVRRPVFVDSRSAVAERLVLAAHPPLRLDELLPLAAERLPDARDVRDSPRPLLPPARDRRAPRDPLLRASRPPERPRPAAAPRSTSLMKRLRPSSWMSAARLRESNVSNHWSHSISCSFSSGWPKSTRISAAVPFTHAGRPPRDSTHSRISS
jgi:hypothetical protein